MIGELAAGRKVLPTDSGDPGPIHLECNTIAFAEDVVDCVGLSLEQQLAALGPSSALARSETEP